MNRAVVTGTPSRMDKPIDPTRRRRTRLLRYIVAAGAVIAAVLFFSLWDVSSKVQIERDKVTIAMVRDAVFHDYIAVLGAVAPIQTVFLDATEGGRVEEIFIREGTKVSKGDPILRLSNENLVLQISNYEAEVARAINDLKSMQLTLENQQYANQTQLIDLEHDLLKLERDVANNEKLIKSHVIANDDYCLTKEHYDRKQKLRDLLRKKIAADSVTSVDRIATGKEMIESMQKNLAVNRERLSMLVARAPASGELATLNPELGQVLSYGTRIGTINILDAYKLKAEVDEYYVGRVTPKLKAVCEFKERDYSAIVSKVYPEVHAGTFTVDLVFHENIPPDIRIGQTAKIRLELGESQRALVVARGGFYNSTGGRWIYVVDPRARIATKRQIKIGRQNPDCFEVLEGLEAGEEVITSGYDAFGNMEKVILTDGGTGTAGKHREPHADVLARAGTQLKRITP